VLRVVKTGSSIPCKEHTKYRKSAISAKILLCIVKIIMHKNSIIHTISLDSFLPTIILHYDITMIS
jgi:hypothetical protein